LSPAHSLTISKQEAARILKVSERRVLRLLEKEEIAGRIEGHEGTWRIYRGSVMAYLEKKQREESKR
jgi:excisionase family DNA binding protein